MIRFRNFFLVLMFLTTLVVLCTGCVRRRMTVLSNPPGATVTLDDKEIGRTPLSTNFDFYGKRKFRLVKEGYETKTVLMPVRAPWYQWFGIDFISEVLLPGKLTDHKYYEFDLQPDQIVPRSELVGRAEDLRRLAHAEGASHIRDGISTLPPATSGMGSLTPYDASQTPGGAVYQQTQPILAPPISPATPGNYVPPR